MSTDEGELEPIRGSPTAARGHEIVGLHKHRKLKTPWFDLRLGLKCIEWTMWPDVVANALKFYVNAGRDVTKRLRLFKVFPPRGQHKEVKITEVVPGWRPRD